MEPSKGVSTQMVLELTDPEGVGAAEVGATLSYLPSSPYAVDVVFHVAKDQTVEWVFARDLLLEGLARPAGDGDVRVWPLPSDLEHFCVLLSSPSGNARFRVPRRPVEELLERSYVMVPRGEEHRYLSFDIDLEIEELIRRSEWRGV